MESYILVIVYIILSFGSYTITETKDEKKKKDKEKRHLRAFDKGLVLQARRQRPVDEENKNNW